MHHQYNALHEEEHERSAGRYRQLLKAYSAEELAAIQRFLGDLTGGA
ncbi:hypothetical protein [Paenibacillus sp. S150]|nr:hypothetical protein [Paenibacillus sp. S150]MBW4084503.1 hypothetical protein [Paenibacillus sp. S150]